MDSSTPSKKIGPKEYKVSEYTMFVPKRLATLKTEFPEIAEADEFAKMGSNDIIFCFLYGHEASPFFALDNRDRAAMAYTHAYEKIPSVGYSGNKANYLNGVFPEKIKAGIRRMETYKMSVRVRMLKMTEKILDDAEKILSIDVSNDALFLNKDGDVDFSKKKAYMDTAGKVLDMMPGLLKRMESGYGLKEVSTVIDEKGEMSFIDDFHEEDED